MEIYPTINTQIVNENIYAFDKLDGSNIRAEWARKQGFVRFGTRQRLLDPREEPLGEAVPLILNGYAEELDRILRRERFEKATVFFEFYGEHSFAGNHETEPHRVMLLDVHKYKQGFLVPREFLKLFGDRVPTAELLYQGKANQPFVESVKNGQLEGMTFEGVVCKGGRDQRNQIIQFKVKNRAWLAKLREKCGDDEKLFEALA
jgi:hypothetical protein